MKEKEFNKIELEKKVDEESKLFEPKENQTSWTGDVWGNPYILQPDTPIVQKNDFLSYYEQKSLFSVTAKFYREWYETTTVLARNMAEAEQIAKLYDWEDEGEDSYNRKEIDVIKNITDNKERYIDDFVVMSDEEGVGKQRLDCERFMRELK